MPSQQWPVRNEDAYAILGVPPDADDDEVAAAYRSLARRHHPDVAGEDATRRMSRINAAFDLLRDAVRRDAYDMELDAADEAAGRAGGRVARRRARRAQQEAAAARAAADGARRTPQGRRFDSPVSDIDGPRPAYGWTAERDGTGGAGPAPGRPSGSVLDFGRHIGWSLGEIARVDPGYLEWLEGRREGKPYLDEIDEVLLRTGFRAVAKRPANVPPPVKGRRRLRRA